MQHDVHMQTWEPVWSSHMILYTYNVHTWFYIHMVFTCGIHILFTTCESCDARTHVMMFTCDFTCMSHVTHACDVHVHLWNWPVMFTCEHDQTHTRCSHVIYYFTCDVHMWFWAWDEWFLTWNTGGLQNKCVMSHVKNYLKKY